MFSVDGFKVYLMFVDGGDGGVVMVKVGILLLSIMDV